MADLPKVAEVIIKMDPTVIVLLLSVLFLVIVLMFTLALSNLAIPRYRTSTSQAADDTPPHFAGRARNESFALERGFISDSELDALEPLAHLGGWPTGEPTRETEEEEIAAQYFVSYAQRVYLNQLFRLRVAISMKGTPMTVAQEHQVAARGPLRFIHRWFPKQDDQDRPRPDIRVALRYDATEFRVANPVKIKSLPEAGELTYDFMVKALKSEDLVLSVEIAHVGSKWQPRQVTMVEITEDNNRISKTTKVTPACIVEEIVLLASKELTIETKSFLNMNAASLNIFSKGTAVLLTVIYIGLVLGFGLTDDTTATLIVGLSSVVSALGIPVAGDIWKNAQVKRATDA